MKKNPELLTILLEFARLNGLNVFEVDIADFPTSKVLNELNSIPSVKKPFGRGLIKCAAQKKNWHDSTTCRKMNVQKGLLTTESAAFLRSTILFRSELPYHHITLRSHIPNENRGYVSDPFGVDPQPQSHISWCYGYSGRLSHRQLFLLHRFLRRIGDYKFYFSPDSDRPDAFCVTFSKRPLIAPGSLEIHSIAHLLKITRKTTIRVNEYTRKELDLLMVEQKLKNHSQVIQDLIAQRRLSVASAMKTTHG